MTEQGGAVQAVAKTEAWMASVVHQLDQRTDQLRSLLGSDAAVERFKTVALHSVVHDTGLRDVDALSVVEAIREAAVLSLDVYGPLGEAWILPYGKTARLSIGYRGLLKLIRQSERVSFVDAQVVYMRDEFDVEFGTNPHILHRPLVFGERDERGELEEDRGNYRGAYAWAQLAGAPFPLIEWMPLVDIEQVRKASPAVRAGRQTPWDTWYSEMARKSPLRRLAKRLPLSPVAAQALAYESESDELAETVHAPAPGAEQARSSRAQALKALEARGYAVSAGNGGEPTEVKPETAPEAQPAAEDPGGTRTQLEEQSQLSVAPTPAEESINAPIVAGPVPPRPPAPVEDDDSDLAELVSRMELGGEGG
jgi:recombination protein RecT